MHTYDFKNICGVEILMTESAHSIVRSTIEEHLVKKIISILLILMITVSSTGIITYAGDFANNLYLEYDGNVYKYNSRVVTIDINGTEVKTGDMPAVIIDGSTLVPVREVFESDAFGAAVTWNGDKQEIYIAYEDQMIVMKIDSLEAFVNGKAHTLSVAPKLVRDMSRDYAKTMIPLRFVSEVLAFEVTWDADTYMASLKNDAITPTTPVAVTTPTPEPTEVPEKKPSIELVAPAELPEEVETTEPIKTKDPTPIASTDSGLQQGDKLDGLTGEGASRSLPTALKNNPISWSASEEQLEELVDGNIESAITDESHSETQIKKIKYDDTGMFKTFTLEATSAMSSVDYFAWDGKFIMDISNAVNKLPAEQPFENNPILTSVRASQYSVAPNSVRVVFDIKDGGNKFALSFNEDRTKLMIKIMDNSIHKILLGQNDVGDFIQVTGVAAPDVKMFRLSQPDRIVIDFPNTQSVIGFNEELAQGQYVDKIRTAQFDDTTTRIVVEMAGQADYEIVKADGGQTMIQFKEPGYENIEYQNDDKPTIAINQVEQDIDVAGIRYVNDYMNRRFEIILSKNYGELFGEGSLKVNDGIIDTVEVGVNEDGLTEIVIQSTTVYEYRIEEDGDKIYVRAYKPKQLYDKIVVVDAGHGGKDPGAVANGLYEKDLNLTITKYLKEHFDGDDIQVYYTRLEDTYPTLQERCDIANEVEADLFLSVHNNAYNPSETGTETLYFPSSEVGKLTSPELGRIFQDVLVKAIGSENRGLKQRENLFVLKHTSMPAIISEIGFLTNTNDANNLKRDSYLRAVAKGLYEATLKTFTAYPTGR